jgi:hypothetical protein
MEFYGFRTDDWRSTESAKRETPAIPTKSKKYEALV